MKRRGVWLASLGVFLLLTLGCFWWQSAPPTETQQLTLTFPQGYSGQADPIIVTGRPDEADFLAVNYLDEDTITFRYDSWGHGGPVSLPIKIVPGKSYPLEIVLPSVSALVTSANLPPDRARIIFDGQPVLDSPVAYYQRSPQNIWFGRNPVGGSICGAVFRGTLLHHAEPPPPFWTAFSRWLSWGRWQLAGILILSSVGGWIWSRSPINPCHAIGLAAKKAPSILSTHRAFLITAGFCSFAFAALISSGTFRLIYPEIFGQFYDHQALSLLHGRFDVPIRSLCGEAFLIEGQAYGYFGPTPALLRMPFIVFGVFFGDVSRISMLLYFLILLGGAYAVLRDAVRRLRPAQPEPAAGETILFTLHVGLGSTAFFLSSRAFTYHEAILCGMMFAVWSCWCALRHLAKPTSRWWILALILGIFSIQARATTGFFALLVLIACVLLPAWADWRARRLAALRRPFAIAFLAGLGVLSFNAVSYIKFGNIEGCPLRLNVQYDAARLAKIDSKQFHLVNIPYGLGTYFLRPRLVIRPRTPWLFMPEILPPDQYPEAKIDLADYTLSLPVGMTGLFLLASVGSAWAFWRRPIARQAILVLWLAFIPLCLALCAAVATAERYTGDFVPFLICAGAYSLASLPWGRCTKLLFGITTLWACAITVAVTVNYQGCVIWGVPPEVTADYLELCKRVDRFFGVSP